MHNLFRMGNVMKLRALSIAVLLPVLAAPAPAQGYRGPGGADTAPDCPDMPRTPPRPYPGPADTTPRGGLPGAFGPAGPGAPGPNTPGPAPAQPNYPAPPNVGPNSPASLWVPELGIDVTSWELWWRFNCEPYLALRARLRTAGVVTGSDDFFLGRGSERLERGDGRPTDELVRDAVVPELSRLLEGERDDRLIVAELGALSRAGAGRPDADRLVDPISKFLTHPNSRVAEEATVALGVLGAERAVGVLESMVQCNTRVLPGMGLDFGPHVPMRQRAFAAYALGLIGQNASEYTRLRILHTLSRAVLGYYHVPSSPDLPAACVAAMGLVRTPLAPDEEAAVVRRSAALLNRQELVHWLLDAFDDAQIDEDVRACAPIAIARLLADVPEERAIHAEALGALLDRYRVRRTEPAQVRASLAIALGELADSDTDELDTAVRSALAAALDAAGGVPERCFATMALGRAAGRAGTGRGDPLAGAAVARTTLLERLAKGSMASRNWSALALGVLERSRSDAGRPTDADTLRALRERLREAGAPDEVGACAIALGIARDPEAAPVLLARLENTRDGALREHLAVALGMVEARAAAESLESLLDQGARDPEHLRSYALGFAMLGPGRAVDALVERLGDNPSLPERAASADALGRIGDRRALAELVGVARDGDATAGLRTAALLGLGRLVEHGDLPWTVRYSVHANYAPCPPSLTSPSSGDGLLDRL